MANQLPWSFTEIYNELEKATTSGDFLVADQSSNKPSPTKESAAAATAAMENHVSAAVQGAKDYNTKFMEFAQTNTEAAFAFAQKLLGAKSPSDFVEFSVEHSRKQIETLTKQTKELAELAQKVTLPRKV